MNAYLHGQCPVHFSVNLNREVDIAFHSHPIGNLYTHIAVKADEPTSECRKLPQSN